MKADALSPLARNAFASSIRLVGGCWPQPAISRATPTKAERRSVFNVRNASKAPFRLICLLDLTESVCRTRQEFPPRSGERGQGAAPVTPNLPESRVEDPHGERTS